MVPEGPYSQSVFSLDFLFINSQGIVNILVTPNGFFVKFQGALVLCLSELCLLLHFCFFLVALLTFQRMPTSLDADLVGYVVPHKLPRQSALPRL